MQYVQNKHIPLGCCSFNQWCSRGGTPNNLGGDAITPNDIKTRGNSDTVAFPQVGL